RRQDSRKPEASTEARLLTCAAERDCAFGREAYHRRHLYGYDDVSTSFSARENRSGVEGDS
ncbi:hypothetical protein Tco_0616987, partial [Tanacetum coccineum]